MNNNNNIVHIEKNIAMIDETIIYAFKVNAFANLKSDVNDLKGSAKVLEDILKAINMPGGIISIPSVFDKTLAKEWYSDQYNKYFKLDLKDVNKKLSQEYIDASANSIMNDYYLYFIDNRKDMFLKKSIAFKSILENMFSFSRSKRDIELLFNEALITNEVIAKEAANYYNQISECTENELSRLINVIDFPLLNKVELHSKYESEDAYHLTTRYQNVNTGDDIKIYSKYITVTEFPISTEPTLGIGDIMNLPYPIYMHIKFDFKHDDEFITTVEQKKNVIDDDIKKYQKNTHKTNYADIKTKVDVGKLYKGTIHNNLEIDFTIRFQVYFRISGKDLKRVDSQYTRLFKELKKKKMNADTLVGRQQEAHQNFKMENNTMFLNTHQTELSFFTYLNPLGSSVVGSKKGFLLLKDFYKNNAILFDFRSIMDGDTKNASTTGVITGGTGSGKTFVADMLAFNAAFFQGYKVVKLLPKSDILKIGNNLHYLKDHIKIMRIGDLDNLDKYRGILDPCVLYKHNYELMLSNIKKLIKSYSDSYEIEYDEYEVNKIVEDVKKENVSLTMSVITKRLGELENTKKIGLTLYNRKNHPLDSLFFSEDGINSIVFDKIYNVIQLTNLPRKTDGGSNKKEYKVEQMLVDQVFESLAQLLDERISNDDYEYIIQYDEYKLVSQYPMGKALPYNLNRVLRSAASFLLLITQNTTDVDEGLFNNVGFYFIGNLESKAEIDYGKKFYKLSDFGQKFLQSRLELAVSNESKKKREYPFVFRDYNNNTSIVCASVTNKDILEDFKDAKVNKKTA